MGWLFFCVTLTAKINAIPGGDSKELRMNHRAKLSPYFAAVKSNATP
jgi:hypothetical protein